ncbi:hypothetical protein DL96DRAFT_1552101 [Flagelloscypha sp. PMI_526]|nr:hypothetical protein DL96DRAFT_1552101 [Flagelloscypha sp. PMI_526]
MSAFNPTIVSYQYVAYASLKFHDPLWLRTLVVILFVIDTSQTIVELYGIWYFAVENYTNPGVLAAAGACLFGVIACTKVGLLADVTKFVPLIPLVIVWLALEAGLDIIITTILSRALWRSKTGLARTNTIIHRCIRAAIQSGLFTSVFAFADLVGFVFWTDTYLYIIFGWPLGRIYSSTFLYTLIIRKDLSRIAYGTSQAGHAGVNSLPMSLQISSVHFRQDTAAETEAEVDGDNAKTSLDPLPTGSVLLENASVLDFNSAWLIRKNEFHGRLDGDVSDDGEKFLSDV